MGRPVKDLDVEIKKWENQHSTIEYKDFSQKTGSYLQKHLINFMEMIKQIENADGAQ